MQAYPCIPKCDQGGTPEENAVALRAPMEGETSAYRDAVLFNAAAALVADQARDLKAGVELARDAIDSGRAMNAIKTLANDHIGGRMSETVLDRIKAYKLEEVAADKASKPYSAVEEEAKAAGPTRGFAKSLIEGQKRDMANCRGEKSLSFQGADPRRF